MKRKDSGAQILFLVQEYLQMQLRSAQILTSGLAGARSCDNRATDSELQETKDYIAVVTGCEETSLQFEINRLQEPHLRRLLSHDRRR